jgi:hypothetical protein
MGNCFVILVALLTFGALAIGLGCWRCGGPFELVVYLVDAVLDHR